MGAGPTSDELDDSTLVAAARAGDSEAMEQLLRRHHTRLHTLCRRLTGDPHDAEDCTQQALIAIVRGIRRFDGRSAFSTWAYRVATNACLDELRRRSRRPVPISIEDRDTSTSTPAPGPDPAGAVVDRMALDAALRALPEAFRVPVVLRDVVGMDYAEIAEVTGSPPGTVRSRIARGRAALAESLGIGNQVASHIVGEGDHARD